MRSSITAEAIRRAGGVRALAEALNLSTQAVSQWRVIPVNRVITVERLTGIPREELRPDIYPPRPPPP